ncbi:MAG: septum formation initiator family protein [Candidatus Marinimicrobia bacterium]|nr:septum formation initiator family protein [Candidatus Neomarinimicrobiota bacterium]
MSSRVQRSRRRKSTPSRAATEFQRKFIRAFLLLIGITLVIIFIFGDHGVYQLVRLKQERKVTQAAITQLREERKQLEDEKYKLETDLDYTEQLARERYRMAKKGEKVFKVIPKEDDN